MKLRSYTIVPPELYVQRRADAQLKQIIDDMGRPGYVLVARQMGKTNLLLNAKRSSGQGDFFVYLDVSNVIPDERGFFRSVIDLAVETAQERGVFVGETIELERDESELLPHKEHERELRRVLQSTSGRVVICLDEIDALTKTGYSDNVFSFIRSTYFSGRANFPEFERLTYILSGVAEPGDLIKNKAVSPFNIGEKIYLDDFSFEEVQAFFRQAEIELSLEVVQAVFDWTSGHPRMMWDLVAQLQRDLASSASEVETSVKQLYFSSVDVPPVDHIKALVESSQDIRDALIAIHYKKSEAISGAIRTKLYLAGISEFDPNTRRVTFKNRILELALSEQFILSLERSQPTYEAAIRSYQAGLFEDALAGFVGFVKSAPEDSRIPIGRYWAGVCCYSLGQYMEALGHLNRLDDFELPLTAIAARKFFLGMSLLKIGQPREAVPYLKQAVAAKGISDFPSAHIQASVALADAVIRIGMRPDEQLFTDALSLCQEIVDQAEVVKKTMNDADLFSALQVDAHIALAKAASIRESRERAFELLDQARKHADAGARLRLAMLEHALAANRAESSLLLQKAIAEALNIKVFDQSREEDDTPIVNVLALIRELSKAGREDQLLMVADHFLNHLAASADVYSTMDDLVVELYNGGSRATARRLVDIALKVQSTRAEPRHGGLLSLAIIIQEADSDRFADEYFACFDERSEVEIDELRFVSAVTLAAISHGNAAISLRGLELMRRVESVAQQNSEMHEALQAQSVQLLLEYCEVMHALRFGPTPTVATRAGGLIRRLNKVNNFEISLFPTTYPRVMVAELAARIRRLSPSAPIKRAGKKYGRNDIVRVIYGDDERTGKYKHFEKDIKLGLCLIVD